MPGSQSGTSSTPKPNVAATGGLPPVGPHRAKAATPKPSNTAGGGGGASDGDVAGGVGRSPGSASKRAARETMLSTTGKLKQRPGTMVDSGEAVRDRTERQAGVLASQTLPFFCKTPPFLAVLQADIRRQKFADRQKRADERRVRLSLPFHRPFTAFHRLSPPFTAVLLQEAQLAGRRKKAGLNAEKIKKAELRKAKVRHQRLMPIPCAAAAVLPKTDAFPCAAAAFLPKTDAFPCAAAAVLPKTDAFPCAAAADRRTCRRYDWRPTAGSGGTGTTTPSLS